MSDSSNKTNIIDKTIVITQKAELNPKNQSYEPYLIQISGRETGQMHNLMGKTIVIGRDPSCNIMVDDPHVSRAHAELKCIEGTDRIVISDRGSTNGIFVNGTKVTEIELKDGDKILIGTRLYFKFCYQDSVDQNYQQNLFNAANMDALTQLYNKKYFIDALSKEFSFAKRDKQALSLMMLDIDFFKKINDTFGHQAGDHVLKTVGQHIQKHIRLENVACRYGGEEFAVILRNVSPELAHTIAERLRSSIASETIQFREHSIKITISIGIAALEESNFATIEDFIHQADSYLYEAKSSGRNRTIMASRRAA